MILMKPAAIPLALAWQSSAIRSIQSVMANQPSRFSRPRISSTLKLTTTAPCDRHGKEADLLFFRKHKSPGASGNHAVYVMKYMSLPRLSLLASPKLNLKYKGNTTLTSMPSDAPWLAKITYLCFGPPFLETRNSSFQNSGVLQQRWRGGET